MRESDNEVVYLGTAPTELSTHHIPPRRFQYPALSSATNTRLLYLEHINESSLQIFAHLAEVDLRDNPQFNALSYTWGPALSEQSAEPLLPPLTLAIRSDASFERSGYDEFELAAIVASDGAETTAIPLQQNLSDFLRRHMRRPQLSNAEWPLPLWIDAVCINQEDPAEKRAQISLMGEIYASAQSVLVWLGEDAQDLQCVYWFNRTFLPAVFHFGECHGLEQGELRARIRTLDPHFWRQEVGLEPFAGWGWDECFATFLRFFARRCWFRRAWVVQEVALAWKIEMFCHDLDLKFEALNWLQHAVTENSFNIGLSLKAKGFTVLDGTRIKSFRVLCSTRRLVQVLRQQDHLSRGELLQFWANLLGGMREFSATYIADRALSTVGLIRKLQPITDAETLFQGLPMGTDKEEVYRWVSEVFVSNGVLELFAQAPPQYGPPELPSWVPDWSWPSAARGICDRLERRNATCVTTHAAMPRVVDKRLLIKGLKVDTIKRVCGRNDVPCMFSFILDCQKHRTHTSQSIAEALWRTVTLNLDQKPATCPASKSGSRYFRRSVEHALAHDLKEGYLSQHTFEGLRSKLCAVDAGFEELIPTLKDVKQRVLTLSHSLTLYQNDHLEEHGLAVDALSKLRDEECLFFTSGKFLGLGHTPREGDEVWIVPGLSVPILLRVADVGNAGTYRHLGTCYVHGVMQGEFLTDGWENRLSHIEIV